MRVDSVFAGSISSYEARGRNTTWYAAFLVALCPCLVVDRAPQRTARR